ncbi:SufE family protein [Methylobacterium oxalidis]|uniref:Cysteine desufuration protein SufE n=1 Tax=Methylobacterium oxalidis TaxID=944322 RepID=A0A512JA09_9HYPH|nr:SufE family protein [Methylobacterium oxalidis]GEP06765.1 cysteine desufuration protein SufE [Methylobacterium oxalidis]GJE35587.1 Cysteine desulfuration protein SufE [Methylobacterium oxalidis]GLS67973.1 cysteine desulfurization protein SufE [Methylobacterium oxalidis]
MLPPISTIIENFEFIEEWEDRYAYVIELGREMPRLPPERCTEENRVHGCESQVWLESRLDESGGRPVLVLQGDSDSSITRGLVALMIAIYAGKTPEEIAATDGLDVFKRLDFGNHITSKRAGGLRAMNERIQREAHKLSA